MKCINNKIIGLSISIALFGSLLAGCGQEGYQMAYTPNHPVSSYRLNISEANENTATPFAADLCVADGDVGQDLEVDMSQAGAAGLFALDSNETIYAKNVYEQLAPASLTKVMTALVACKYGSPEDILTASANVKITESGAQTSGIKEGDKMTLTQALHLLLINSANDAAILIAEGVAGSVENFSDMMNEEAAKIGATNSHFVNPHGLTAEDHYVTVFDMYLIFNEALEFELIKDIIGMSSYTTVYKDKEGMDKEITVNTTNLYLQGEMDAPDSVTVIGGKTGTTKAAGNCLVLLSRDAAGKSYISVILKTEERNTLYQEMTDLLGEIL